MSWGAVARKDFSDAVRVRWFWALGALFIVFAGGGAYLYAEFFSGLSETTGIGFIGFLSTATGILVPVIGLVLGYKTIAGERESGSLKLLLSLPHTRGEVVAGKLVGRSAVVSIAILVGYLVAMVIGVALFAEFSIVDFLTFTGLSVLLACAWIGISLGLSTATGSTSRAAVLAFGFWLVVQFLWDIVITLLVWAEGGFALEALGNFPDWALFLSVIMPNSAFGNANGIVADSLGATGQSTPWFTEPWFGLLVLVAWVVVPVGLGYLRFRNADL